MRNPFLTIIYHNSPTMIFHPSPNLQPACAPQMCTPSTFPSDSEAIWNGPNRLFVQIGLGPFYTQMPKLTSRLSAEMRDNSLHCLPKATLIIWLIKSNSNDLLSATCFACSNYCFTVPGYILATQDLSKISFRKPGSPLTIPRTVFP